MGGAQRSARAAMAVLGYWDIRGVSGLWGGLHPPAEGGGISWGVQRPHRPPRPPPGMGLPLLFGGGRYGGLLSLGGGAVEGSPWSWEGCEGPLGPGGGLWGFPWCRGGGSGGPLRLSGGLRGSPGLAGGLWGTSWFRGGGSGGPPGLRGGLREPPWSRGGGPTDLSGVLWGSPWSRWGAVGVALVPGGLWGCH